MPFSVWKKDKNTIIAWGVMLLPLLFFFMSTYYSDMWETYHDGLRFTDYLMEGRFFEYYKTNASLYFVPIYIIFGIWNFPIWVASHFFHADIDSMGCLLWSKGIILLFTVGCIWMLCNILREMKYDNLEYAVFLFASSLIFVFPAMVAVQYDVIELFFLLCALFLYVKDKKLSWRSLLFFSVAISIKLFALFIFLLLILAEEKRILYIIRNMIFGMSLTIISMLPFWNRGYWHGTGGRNISFGYALISNNIPGGLSPISIFLFGYLMLCAVAYFYKKKDIRDNLRFIVWLSAVFFLLLFGFVNCHPYWIILYLPFLVMIIVEHKENLKVNLLMETGLELVAILAYGITYNWVYFSGSTFAYLIFKKINMLPDEEANFVSFLSMSDGGTSMCMIVASTVFIACGIVLLAVNNPWKPILCESTEEEIVLVKKVSRILRIGIMVMLLCLMLIIIF